MDASGHLRSLLRRALLLCLAACAQGCGGGFCDDDPDGCATYVAIGPTSSTSAGDSTFAGGGGAPETETTTSSTIETSTETTTSSTIETSTETTTSSAIETSTDTTSGTETTPADNPCQEENEKILAKFASCGAEVNEDEPVDCSDSLLPVWQCVGACIAVAPCAALMGDGSDEQKEHLTDCILDCQ